MIPLQSLRRPRASVSLASHYWLAMAAALLLVAAGCQQQTVVVDQNSLAASPPAADQGESLPQPAPGSDNQTAPQPTASADKPAGGTASPSQGDRSPDDDRLVDKTFDDLKFDIEPDAPFSREMLTGEIEAMFGQRIRIRGYILPTYQREGITQFILVRDDQECCFGPGAALYDCIVVEMQPGKSTNFSVRPVAVEGRFSFKELVGPDDKHLAIFHLEGESVK